MPDLAAATGLGSRRAQARSLNKGLYGTGMSTRIPKAGAHSTAVVLAVLIIALWLYLLSAGGLLEQYANSTMTGLVAFLNMSLVMMAVVFSIRNRPKTSVVLALAAFFPVGLYLLVNPFPAFLLGAMELALLLTVNFAWWRTRKELRA